MPKHLLENLVVDRLCLLPSIELGVRPNAGACVARAGGEQAACLSEHGAGCDRYNRILVALQHQLRLSGARVPELDALVLRAREHPPRVGGKRDAEDIALYLGLVRNTESGMKKGEEIETYPVALKRLDAVATRLEQGLMGRPTPLPRCVELPQLNGLVKAAAEKLALIRRECNTKDRICVAVGSLEKIQEVASIDFPHSYRRVKAARRH